MILIGSVCFLMMLTLQQVPGLWHAEGHTHSLFEIMRDQEL